ncbi:MAG: prop effector [Bdellovibrionales bacterium]|nr:prop effector [Ramlibacter sp.]
MTATQSPPVSATDATPAKERTGRRNGRPQQPRKPQPAAARREPNPVLERLFELYPSMFGARFLPLKLGVYQELLALHGEEFKKEDLKLALGLHARSTRYLESVANGSKRHNLQGEPVEDLSPEHIHHAILEVHRRRQARSKDDLRPALVARMAGAVEASGLGRESWDERVGATDELSVSVLDEAFAMLAERTARREALKRAFEASGRTVAEFAEMYGMDVADVQRALAQPA